MAEFKQHLNVANFTCKFGDDIALLDLCTEVVIPAFTNSLERSFKDSDYFLHEVKLVDLSNNDLPEMAIAGRLVKATKIAREQIFQGGQIIKDPQEMSSAPTSFFVLLLSNHKLLYVREQAASPLLSTFASTIKSFLKRAHQLYINDLYHIGQEIEKPMTKAELLKRVPSPTLDIIELSTEADISSFLRKFKVINSVEIRLINTNHEIDNSELFSDLRSVKESIGADKFTVTAQTRGKVGLDSQKVSEYVATPAAEGNTEVTIGGKSMDGERLRGNNENFKFSTTISKISTDVGDALVTVMTALNKQISNGMLVLKSADDVARAKLRKIIKDRGNNGIQR